MYNFYSNYYITFIILSILFFQYYALENNVENDDSTLLNFIQNDLSSKNFINYDTLVHSVSGNKYLRKRQADGREGQKKSVAKKMSKPKVLPKKPSTKKPGVKPQALRKTTSKTTRRTTTKRRLPTTTHKRPTRQPTRIPTKPAPKSTTKRPVVPPKKPATSPNTSKKTSPPATTTKTSITTKSSATSTSTFTSKPRPNLDLEPYADKKRNLIKEINDVRRDHKAPELVVDQDLSYEAQRLTTFATQQSQNVRYNGDDGLLIYYSNKENPIDPIDEWFAGYNSFNFDDPEKDSSDHSNLTQLLWAKSKKIGCGIDKYTDKDVLVVVCLISPKGNIPGHYRENVHKHV
uniref:SCP domain-containing protein n=1 Tax=Strongyloides papillosus TaxID=174720 RepID=A0A0N5BXZ9_STREA